MVGKSGGGRREGRDSALTLGSIALAEESEAEKRKHSRSPMLLKVEYSNTNEFWNAYTENISLGGLFIATRSEFQPGDWLDFAISFPGLLDPIAIRAEVVWRRSDQSGGQPAGIGVRFDFDRSPGREPLKRLLDRLQARDRPKQSQQVAFRVLLVEDNLVVRDMFRYGIQRLSTQACLAPTRIDVIEADDGRQALELLQREHFHLVILDLFMPVMDGCQLLASIRADPKLCGLPVLVVSSGNSDGRKRALESGADVYLDKPIKLKQMMETIETLIAIGHQPRKKAPL